MTSVELGGIAIVGSGLVGCLLAIHLRKHNFPVTLFEARPDPRLVADQGRSINLVITSRGIASLAAASTALADKVMQITVPVFGRTLHNKEGECTYQAYGPSSSFCNFSVSRWHLNTVLIAAAEEAGCTIHFGHSLAHLDVPTSTLYFYLQDPRTTQLYQKRVKCEHVFGTDGGGSRCRQALKGFLGDRCTDISEPLGYAYKELTMPAYKHVDGNSLHIWPRGSHFMMGLPNQDGSFTMTLFMPSDGPISFAQLDSPQKVTEYFKEYYPDALSLMPDYLTEYLQNPLGFLGTVFMSNWHFEDKLMLLGDAAHAITPFFGQGCNAGFEDVHYLHNMLSGERNIKTLFTRLFEERKANADAIAHMALENFHEMMTKTADPKFILQKAIEIELANRFPTKYVSRYALVTHSLVPYSTCQSIGLIQSKILGTLSAKATKVEEVNWKMGEEMIENSLVPFLKQQGITPDMFHYVSKYYPVHAVSNL